MKKLGSIQRIHSPPFFDKFLSGKWLIDAFNYVSDAEIFHRSIICKA